MGILELISSFIQGFLYGFSLAAPPGPMNALIANRSLLSFKTGFLTGLGAMTADFIFMIITYLAYDTVKAFPLVPIYIIGGLYMLYLAISILKSKENLNENRKQTKAGNSFMTSLALGISNPYQILWWLTAGLSFIAIFGPMAVVGLFSAIAVWITIFPMSIRMGYGFKQRLTILLIKGFSFVVLLVFAILILVEGLSSIINL
ncbi:MAG TPA: LysE family translocator [Geobacterales bacterium]|nr:LysE family translocator [Geobacterales bacterium]